MKCSERTRTGNSEWIELGPLSCGNARLPSRHGRKAPRHLGSYREWPSPPGHSVGSWLLHRTRKLVRQGRTNPDFNRVSQLGSFTLKPSRLLKTQIVEGYGL
jgi:hypothetical protein